MYNGCPYGNLKNLYGPKMHFNLKYKNQIKLVHLSPQINLANIGLFVKLGIDLI